jgi:hypothetical protein
MRWNLAVICVALSQSAAIFGQVATNTGGKIAFADTVFDFGKIRAGDMAKHTFVFTNVGPDVLSVTHVQPSCGCTATADWTRTVEPGKTGSIPIQFNSGSFNGHVLKTITVASSDKSQPSVMLQIKGSIWRPIEVSPQFAVINIAPDADSGSAVVKILNNTDEQVTFSEPEISHRSFRATIAPGTNNPGKEFLMTVSAIPPLPSGSVQGQITIKTSSTNAPTLASTVWANVQPALVVLPGQMTLPAPPIAAPLTPSLIIQNNSTNSLQITEPAVNTEGVKIDLRETQPGRQFTVALTFPAGFEVRPGQQVAFTAKSSHPSMPGIRVPIAQLPRPVSAPASAAPPVPVQSQAAAPQPHMLPAVPRQ